jgi:hypothetical protein
MLRGSIEAARDMDAGDEGAVWGRGDALLTGFWRGSVWSSWRTVLDLANSGASKRRDVGEGESKGTVYVHRPGQSSCRPATNEREAYQQQSRRGGCHRQHYDGHERGGTQQSPARASDVPLPRLHQLDVAAPESSVPIRQGQVPQSYAC